LSCRRSRSLPTSPAHLAASYSVLTEDERELGVCVVDIGGGTMDMAVYTGGALRHTKVIPYAGNG
jgi:cell division protein FtsA